MAALQFQSLFAHSGRGGWFQGNPAGTRGSSPCGFPFDLLRLLHSRLASHMHVKLVVGALEVHAVLVEVLMHTLWLEYRVLQVGCPLTREGAAGWSHHKGSCG